MGAHVSSPLRTATDAYYWKPMSAYFCTRELEAYQRASIRLRAPVLDLGCGNGLLASMLRLHGHLQGACVGTDVVPLDDARGAEVYDALCRSSGEKLPFRDGSFASVVSHSVISAVPDVAGTLAEVSRVLAPGGRFVMTVPTDQFTPQIPSVRLLGGLAPRVGRTLAARIERRLQHRQALSVSDWRDRLRDGGLEIECERPFFSTREIRTWSALANPCMRICGVLRVGPLSPLRPLWRATARTILGRIAEPGGDRSPAAAYVLMVARRPEGHSG